MFIFIRSLEKDAKGCIISSVVGLVILLFIFYQIYLGSRNWYIGLSEAHLTIGFFLSCIGFVSVLVASASKAKE
jgi:hypothetical protein